MRTLSNVDLELVTGGKAAPNPASSSRNSSTCSTGSAGDQGLIAAMQGLSKQIADIGKDQNKGLFGGQNGMLLICALMMSQRRGYTEVHVGRRGYSYSYSG